MKIKIIYDENGKNLTDLLIEYLKIKRYSNK